jgi:carboxymethylenebutenolidase
MVIERDQVDVPTPSGPMRTYVYRPATSGHARYPGVLLYSEIFQRTAPIDRSAAYLAGHGYVVAVPEIYHELEPAGTVLAYDAAGAETGNRHKVGKPLRGYDDDARAGLDFLAAHTACTGRLGAIGFCIGGHLAYRTALWPDCLAAVCFQATDLHKSSLGSGESDDSLARASELRGEMLFAWGRQDPHIPVEGRLTIYQRLTEAGVTFTWHEFNAQHAAMRDEGPRFDPVVTRLTWQLALDLFCRRLAA